MSGCRKEKILEISDGIPIFPEWNFDQVDDGF